MKIKLPLLSYALLVALVALGSFACQKPRGVEASTDERATSGNPNSSLSILDKGFIVNAEKSEIRFRNLARVVIDKSTNPDVKNYAQDVIKDSSKALQDVADLMNKKGVSQPPSLPEVKDEAMARLKGLSSVAVDDEFIALMAAEHQTVLARFRKAAETAEDKDVRAYASSVVPDLQKELDKAVDLQTKLRNQNAPAPRS